MCVCGCGPIISSSDVLISERVAVEKVRGVHCHFLQAAVAPMGESSLARFALLVFVF